jgi:hypothetical protein
MKITYIRGISGCCAAARAVRKHQKVALPRMRSGGAEVVSIAHGNFEPLINP